MPTMTISTYDADTRQGDVRSRFDEDVPPLKLSGVSSREHGRIAKAVRAIEQAAYERGAADVLAYTRRFRPNR